MQVIEKQREVVSWDQAEEALIAAFDYLFALPDKERGFLLAGSRSCWPAIVRSLREGDYGEGQGHGDVVRPSPQLSRRRLALVEAMLLGEQAAALAVPAGHCGMVGRVVVLQRWGGAWEWSDVWKAEQGMMTDLRTGQPKNVTSDAMRKAYERAVGKVAVRMEALGIGHGGLD